ncbi:MAG TPA: hypothetical protein VKJ65_01735 [Phycisphaerae bacterium]|nr:hypothetical protein [Phycisphaerae bacterium]
MFPMFDNPGVSHPSERFDAALDMLVDDELPEQKRREFLEQLDKSQDSWRTLAIRFLQQQVERRAVRTMVHPVVVQNASSWRFLGTMRIAATLLLTASLFGLAGLYVGHQNHAAPAAPGALADSSHQAPATSSLASTQHSIQFINTTLPPDLGGSSVQVPVLESNMAPAGYPFITGGSSGLPGNLMIVPDGPNQAVAFPVVPAANDNNKQKVY